MKSEKIKEETAKVIAKWANKRGSLIMALHDIQNAFGYIPWVAMEVVSDTLHVPMGQIYSVVTFYQFFKLKSPGKIIISCCDGTACHLKGSESILSALQNALGIQAGQTTPDGMFHLQVVRCMGCCGLAPIVVANGETHGRVQPAEVSKLVAEWRKKAETMP